MTTESDLIARVRNELGDSLQPFRQTYRGSGFQTQYDLPRQRIQTGTFSLYKTYPATLDDVLLTATTDYTLDADNGIVTLNSALEKDWMLTAQGYAYGLFSDDELTQYVRDAVLQHTSGGESQTVRYRDSFGFIEYQTTATTLANLPPEEELPVAILATIQCLWALLTDASLDIDVITSEGTHIPRSQRYAQLQGTIALLSERYASLCALLGVGLYRIQMSTLRRVSRTTGRLVPIFVEREYDDHDLPVRILPPIDRDHADPDGPPSPAFYPYAP